MKSLIYKLENNPDRSVIREAANLLRYGTSSEKQRIGREIKRHALAGPVQRQLNIWEKSNPTIDTVVNTIKRFCESRRLNYVDTTEGKETNSCYLNLYGKHGELRLRVSDHEPTFRVDRMQVLTNERPDIFEINLEKLVYQIESVT